MSISERGVYAPPLPSELGVRLGDGEDDEPRRGGMLLGVSAMVLFATMGVVWSTYNQGVRVGGRDAPPRITAPTDPYKVAPDEPGGASTEHLDVRVFDVIDGGAATDEAALADADLDPGGVDGRSFDDELSDLAAVEPPAGAGPSDFEWADGPRTLASAGETWRSEPIAPPRGLEPADASPGRAAPAERSIPRPAPEEPAAAFAERSIASEIAPAAEAAPAPAPVGLLVQVASYRSEEAAVAGWAAFLREKGDVFSGYEPDIRRVELGDSGVWYRLRARGFADRAEAQSFCGRLKARGGDCLVVSS